MRRRLSVALLALACAGIAALPESIFAQESTAADEQVLKAAGIAADTATLLRLLDERTLREEDRPALETLVRRLDSEIYDERQAAHAELERRGPVALPFLKAALHGTASLETRRRAEEMMRKMEASATRDVTVAAARLLAARRADGAIDAFLRYLPGADDAWIEDEIRTSLGRLAIRRGEPDARLLAALKDPLPQRRAAVVYLLGRRAHVAHRALIRSYLADPDPVVRERAVAGLLGTLALQAQHDNGSDEAMLKNAGVAATESALLDYLHQRTPDTAEQARLAGLVGQLGSLEYVDRYCAAEALVKANTAALAFLRPALTHPDTEIARRAGRCIQEIQLGSGHSIATAVVRRIASPGVVKDVAAALHTLLDFIPFAEDESVEEEVHRTLMTLSVRQPKVDPVLSAALEDTLPARRAAAAYVLGCTGTEEVVIPVRKLLTDAALPVRLRAAQGLLAARDRAGVAPLIALLGEVPVASLWRIEEMLSRLAAGQVPVDAAGAGLSGRHKAVAAWQQWWHENQDRVDLARATESDAFLGLITVCEYDSVVAGRLAGQAWEAPRNGPARFKLGNLTGPMDAQVLANGRVLVAENGANRVTERDRDGNIKWEYAVQGGNPICCQRLPNGHTFIALYNQLLEVRPDKSEVYRYMPGPQFYIFAARKTRAGTVACITAQGTILEIDPVQHKTVRTIALGQPAGGWSGIEVLPNGNFLVATMNNNTLREVDLKGNTVWSLVSPIPGVFRATRLPNGNHIVVSMSTREVAELDRSGAARWRQACQGRPWSVHYR
jgi:HEAT repeat protein